MFLSTDVPGTHGAAGLQLVVLIFIRKIPVIIKRIAVGDAQEVKNSAINILNKIVVTIKMDVIGTIIVLELLAIALVTLILLLAEIMVVVGMGVQEV